MENLIKNITFTVFLWFPMIIGIDLLILNSDICIEMVQ